MTKSVAVRNVSDKVAQNTAEALGIFFPEPVRVKFADLNPAKYNPRSMPKAQMEALEASILKNGMVLNLVVQKKGMTIIGGHQRMTALHNIVKRKGWELPTHTWATVLDVDDATAKQLNISLNRIDGEFDPHKLGVIFEEIYMDMSQDDVVAVGFKPEEIVELRELVAPPEETDPEPEKIKTFAKAPTMSVEFDSAEQRDKCKQRLEAYAKNEGVKIGALLAKLVNGLVTSKSSKVKK